MPLSTDRPSSDQLSPSPLWSRLLTFLAALLISLSLCRLSLNRGESVSAAWLVTLALGTYWIAYRYYSRFIARRALEIDDQRITPAWRLQDGMDYVPTSRGILFGHHFAAIAGAGPLIGPILAAQMGYLPGALWILVGVVLAGAVQDMTILFFSTRRNAASLGAMMRSEIGAFAGLISSVGILLICVILLAVLALVVVKAMAISPWSSFTLLATLPIALFMGIYLHYIRPGQVVEASVSGVGLLLMALFLGQQVAHSPSGSALFSFSPLTLAWGLMGYALAASVLPVWLLLAPRDYLSTFLKIGTIVALALGILLKLPALHMPAVTTYIDGHGPVFSGTLFPFLFITIACGAVSGFHALVSSGTTPRMLERESHISAIGYGAMLTESFVAIMALIAACMLNPGLYFAMNTPASLIGHDVIHAAATISHWGFTITPEQLTQAARQVGEQSLLSRVGGAPTLAYGLASIMASVTGSGLMAFWYHFAVLFEALFILTTVDAGTRVGRYLLQDLLAVAVPAVQHSRAGGWIATLVFIAGWGYFLIAGLEDPLGGIHTLWPLFGIANQMLAGMALLLGCIILIRMQKQRYVWITLLPACWVLLSTLTAAALKILAKDPSIGFLAHAHTLQAALAHQQLLFPAHSVAEMQQMLHNDWIDSGLCALFFLIVCLVTLQVLRLGLRLWSQTEVSTAEEPVLSAPATRS